MQSRQPLQRGNLQERTGALQGMMGKNSVGAQWGKISLRELGSALGGRQISGSPDTIIGGLSTDTRSITPGQMFLALRGENYDGHNFLKEAVNAGAAGIIVEAENNRYQELSVNNMPIITVSSTLEALGDLASWWREQWGKRVIAITGSNGKTTTKEMAASILSLKEHTMRSPGNFNNLVGLPLTILSLKQEHRTAVLEMGMNRVGEIARLTQIAKPDIGLITNVARAHLEGLGDLQGVAEAKGELLAEMSEDSTAILNGDDEKTMGLASKFRGPVITFGLGKINRVRAVDIRRVGDHAQAFTVCINDKNVPVTINLPGIHNVFNALGGAAIASCMSVQRELISRGLEEFQGANGRFQVIPLSGDIIIIDDTYNSNPSSLMAALQALKDVKSSGLVIGLGEMLELGKESSKHHVDAGDLVARMGVRYLVVLGEHGREMIEGARKAGMDRKQIHLAATLTEMTDALKGNIRDGDTVLLKGSRRMALDKVVAALEKHFGLHRGKKHAL